MRGCGIGDDRLADTAAAGSEPRRWGVDRHCGDRLGQQLVGDGPQVGVEGPHKTSRRTTFLIVTSPEREPVAEAIFFHEQLREARMSFGGLIVNRVNVAGDDDPDQLRAQLAAAGLGAALAEKVAQSAADLQRLAARDAAQIARLKDELDEPDPIVVPRLDREVQDIEGLLALRDALM